MPADPVPPRRPAGAVAVRAAAAILCALVPAVTPPAAATAGIGATGNTDAMELHQKLRLRDGEQSVALTLDACGGEFDARLVDTLVALRVPATVFVTRRWIVRNPAGMAQLKAHPQLFAIENHGAAHVPAIIGSGRRVYGLGGAPDLDHLRAEVRGGAQAISDQHLPAPRWYRGAAAVYDPVAIRAIEALDYRIAGFSVNADAGATLPHREIVARLARVQPGDIILAHMNRPSSDTAEALRDALPRLIARGLQFVTLRDREVQPLPGTVRRTGPPAAP